MQMTLASARLERLIAECRPNVSQVQRMARWQYRQTRTTPSGRLYWERVGAPHLRQRLWWVADAASKRTEQQVAAVAGSVGVLGSNCSPLDSGMGDANNTGYKDGASTLDNTPINGLLGRQVSLSNAPTEKRGALAPEFSRWLMGYPAAWGNCAPTATQSSRKSRPSS